MEYKLNLQRRGPNHCSTTDAMLQYAEIVEQAKLNVIPQ